MTRGTKAIEAKVQRTVFGLQASEDVALVQVVPFRQDRKIPALFSCA